MVFFKLIHLKLEIFRKLISPLKTRDISQITHLVLGLASPSPSLKLEIFLILVSHAFFFFNLISRE